MKEALSIEERLDDLERSNRKLRFIAGSAMLLLLVAVAVGWTQSGRDVLRVKRVEFVDEEGRTRGFVGMTADHIFPVGEKKVEIPELRFTDSRGVATVNLFTSNVASQLNLSWPDNRRVGLFKYNVGLEASQSAAAASLYEDGLLRAFMTADADESTFGLTYLAAQSRMPAALLTHDKEKGVGLQLFDKKGKPFFEKMKK